MHIPLCPPKYPIPTLLHHPPPPQVEDLARISFKHKPLYVGVDDGRSVATREGLEQGYCVVPADKKFLLLFTFLKKNLNKKVRMGTREAAKGRWGSGGKSMRKRWGRRRRRRRSLWRWMHQACHTNTISYVS